MFVVYQSGTILHDDGDGELLSVKGSPTRQVVWGHTHAGRDPDSRYILWSYEPRYILHIVGYDSW